MHSACYKLAALCLLLTAAGCRANGSQELLERELRIQEDRIYELEALLEDREQALACMQDSRPDSKSDSDNRYDRYDREERRSRRRDDRGRPTDDGYESNDSGEVDLPKVEIPDVETPAELERSTTPMDTPVEGSEAPLFKPSGARLDQTPEEDAPLFASPDRGTDERSEAELPEPELRSSRDFEDIEAEEIMPAAGDSRDVNDITLKAPGGSEAVATSERVRVFVEPRDDSGAVVPLAGKIAAVVMDETKSGDEQRAARWDLEADDVAKLFRKTANGPVIDLELPWPDAAPASDDLILFVRYITSDGRILTRRMEIRVEDAVARKPAPRAKPVSERTAPAKAKGANSSRRVSRPTWSPNR